MSEPSRSLLSLPFAPPALSSLHCSAWFYSNTSEKLRVVVSATATRFHITPPDGSTRPATIVASAYSQALAARVAGAGQGGRDVGCDGGQVINRE